MREDLVFSDAWKTTTVTFTGAYDTDNKEYAGKKVKGKEEKAVWKASDKKTNSTIGPTWLVFNIGGISGDFHLRNVVLKEVAKGADVGKEKNLKKDGEGEQDKEAKSDEELTKEEKKAKRKAARKAKKKKD